MVSLNVGKMLQMIYNPNTSSKKSLEFFRTLSENEQKEYDEIIAKINQIDNLCKTIGLKMMVVF